MGTLRRTGQMSGHQTESLLESKNDEEVEHLSGKVSQLKSITIGIGDIINSQNAMLDDMGNTFGDTKTFMGISLKRVGELTKASGGKLMWYIVLFAILVFFVIYFFLR